PRRRREEGRRGARRDRAPEEEVPPLRRQLDPVRQERDGDPAGRRVAEPEGHPHLRRGGPRAPPEEVHQDRVARLGGRLMAIQRVRGKGKKNFLRARRAVQPGSTRHLEKLHVKKDDLVVVISGADKGKRGKILRVIPSEGKV